MRFFMLYSFLIIIFYPHHSIYKSFMLRGRINRQPSLGTYLIPEHELGKITTHIGEQEVRHPEIGKFLVRVRSEGQRLSANTPLIQFGRIKDAAIRAGSKGLPGKN